MGFKATKLYRGGMQDFTTYAETDGPTKVTVAANTITLTAGDRDEDYYVTKDFGAGYFIGFEHWVDVNVTSITASNSSFFGVWALADSSDNITDIAVALGKAITITVGRITANTHYCVKLWNTTGGGSSIKDTSSAIAINTPSYLSISRSGTTLTIQIYSTAAKRITGGTGDVDTVTSAVMNADAFQYIYGLACINDGTLAMDISGTVSNLILKGVGRKHSLG